MWYIHIILCSIYTTVYYVVYTHILHNMLLDMLHDMMCIYHIIYYKYTSNIPDLPRATHILHNILHNIRFAFSSAMVGDHSTDDGSDVGSITIALDYFRPTEVAKHTPECRRDGTCLFVWYWYQPSVRCEEIH